MSKKHRNRQQFGGYPQPDMQGDDLGEEEETSTPEEVTPEGQTVESTPSEEVVTSEPQGSDVASVPAETAEAVPTTDTPAVEPPKEVAPVEQPTVEEPAVVPPPPPVEPPKVELPKTITPKESAVPVVTPSKEKKVMSADILRPSVDPKNAFQNRRAANVVGGKHTVLGNRLLKLLADYRERMKVPTRDRNENMNRIRMLKQIVDTACPVTPLDLQTSTDVVRIMFDEFNANYGKVYKDENLFLLGNTLKGTAYDMDKMVLFVEAFVQMVESIQERKKILFDDARVHKVLRNRNVSLAMCRMRDGINSRLGFPTIAR